MGMNLSRWTRYAKARVESALGKGNAELDHLEAEREAELAGRPWLRSDGEVPTFDDARARIEWEAAEQARRRAGAEGHPAADTPAGPTSAPVPEAPSTRTPPAPAPEAEPTPPGRGPAAADATMARLELEATQRAAAERLEQIRRELGLDQDATDG